MLEQLNEYYEEFIASLEDFYYDYLDFSFEDSEFFSELSDACSQGVFGCYEFASEIPIENILLFIFFCLLTLFIILRIVFYIFKDAEIW